MTFFRIVIPLYLFFEHDLFGKPVPTHRVVARGHAFPDHALELPRAVSTSLVLRSALFARISKDGRIVSSSFETRPGRSSSDNGETVTQEACLSGFALIHRRHALLPDNM